MSTPSMHELTRKLLEAMWRDNRPRDSWSYPTALSVDAASWVAERDQRQLPELFAQFDSEAVLPASVRRMQREWLGGPRTDVEISAYLPTLSYLFADRSRNVEFLSSGSIREVADIVGVGRLSPGSASLTILDQAVGSGALLLSAGQAAAEKGYRPVLRGVEIHESVAVVAAATLFVGGFDADIRVADTLKSDPFPDLTVDLASSQPPFGVSWQSQAAQVRACQRAGWYTFGLPSTSDASWLFVSRQAEKLTAASTGGGRAVAFVTASALSSPTADAVRQRILDADLIETVIALPGGLTEATAPIYALVLANAKSHERRGKVQVVDLRTAFRRSGFREAPRQLRAESLQSLRDALATVRNGPISRTVSNEFFLRERRTVRAVRSDIETRPSWKVNIDRGEASTYLAARYGPIPVEADLPEKVTCNLEFSRLFNPAGAASMSRWLEGTRWPATRLSALLTSAPAVALRDPVDPSTVDVVSMPTTQHQDAVSGVISQEAMGRTRYLLLGIDTTQVLPDYLTSWLNSPHGRDARLRAHLAARSGTVISAVRSEPRALFQLCDELIVPLPPLPVQQEFATAEARLSAASELIEAVRRDVWDTPDKIGEIKQRFDPLFDISLATWASELPYPVASALWTLETRRQNPHATHEQILLVWEAYAAFSATVLLSALVQDSFLAEEELPQLQQSLAKATLSLERATLGTWSAIVQRLSSRFRNQLRSDDTEEQQAVLQLFGGVSAAALGRLLSPEVVNLITDANAKRNMWKGHSGTANEMELREHIDYLTSRLETLRELTGSAWGELLCVRAGDAYKKDGQMWQRVELAMGVSAPFRTQELIVGEIMEKGGLYLCVDGAPRPLQLLSLVILKSSPDSPQDICYFYSRREAKRVRMVSYHLGGSSEISGEFRDVIGAVDQLVGASQVVD